MAQRKPGIYIPTLYFAEGLPYTIVMMMSAVYFKSLGASNVFIGLTTLLSLPWSLKFLWAPLVDFKGTKRGWVIVSQAVLSALCFALALGVALNVPDLINFSIIMLAAMALGSATHDVSIDGYYLDILNKEQQSFFVGIRSAAYKMAWLFGSGLMVYLAGQLETQHGLHIGWAVAFGVVSLLLAGMSCFHALYLPAKERPGERELDSITAMKAHERAAVGASSASTNAGGTPSAPVPPPSLEKAQPFNTPGQPPGKSENKVAEDLTTRKLTLREFVRAIVTYFEQKGALPIICYILLFRLGDALMLKQATNFLQDPVTKGGMALSVKEIGMLYGTVGMIFLLIGGIVGAWLVSRHGLRRWFWPAALFQNSAIILYYLLATYRPGMPWLYVVNSIEQFAYGVGVSAYMVFLLRTIRNEYKAAHYAVATGFMTLGMLIPGTISGYLYESLGYANFFLISFMLSIPGMITIFFLPYWRDDDKVA